VAPIARLQLQGISRDQLVTLHQQAQDLDLADPTVVLDAPEEAFKGILSALQIARLKQAIVVDIHDSMVRKRAGHLARAEHAAIPRRVVEELYNAEGAALEQAVADALNQVGLSASRVLRQSQGEEDVRLAHAGGTVIISVTASRDSGRPIRWNKA